MNDLCTVFEVGLIVSLIGNALMAIVMLRLFAHHEKVVTQLGKERELKHAATQEAQYHKLILAEHGVNFDNCPLLAKPKASSPPTAPPAVE